ncbi:MAG: holo-ACP synthase [Planctomycetes bacterium]|nr:holo-ACP synthase [Planctomycetota bacterium]
MSGVLRHGVDLVHVPALRAAVEGNPALEAGLFTEGERAYAHARPDPWPHFAARFAAKEAVLKALRRGLSTEGPDAALHEIEVVREHGAPRLVLTGRIARAVERLGLDAGALSLSHAGDLALASVVFGARP